MIPWVREKFNEKRAKWLARSSKRKVERAASRRSKDEEEDSSTTNSDTPRLHRLNNLEESDQNSQSSATISHHNCLHTRSLHSSPVKSKYVLQIKSQFVFSKFSLKSILNQMQKLKNIFRKYTIKALTLIPNSLKLSYILQDPSLFGCCLFVHYQRLGQFRRFCQSLLFGWKTYQNPRYLSLSKSVNFSNKLLQAFGRA